ncbi:helix-turn-helix transcriptional regulator [Verrucomicrobiales bacterium BCK34]|nr:helix-turn-helix transcriptional regulator [Verrucomicrobiales bacterium BCK34]
MIQLSELRQRKMDIDIAAPSRHRFHFLKFVTEGSGSHWVDFTKHAVAKGDVLQVRPGQVHAFDADSDHEALLLVFRPETVSPDQIRRLAVNLTEPFSLEPRDHSALVQLLQFIQQMDEVPEELRLTSMAPGLLHAILSGLNDLYIRRNEKTRTPAHNRASELIFRIETLLRENSKRQSLADYTDQLNVTPRTLARACHTIRGMNPKRLIDQHFVMEAKRRLVLGDETVEEIAFDLGFSEATNFVKFFKRIAETTPQAFRQEQRKL